MNEQKALVARLETLQLGLYEYAMRLSKLEKINFMQLPVSTTLSNDTARKQGARKSPSPAFGKGSTPTTVVTHQAALHQAYYAGQGIDSSQVPSNPFPYNKTRPLVTKEKHFHAVPGSKASSVSREAVARVGVTQFAQGNEPDAGQDRDMVPSPRSSLADKKTDLLYIQSKIRSGSPTPVRRSKSPLSPVNGEESNKDNDDIEQKSTASYSRSGNSPVMFDDSIAVTVYDTNQQEHSQRRIHFFYWY